MQDSNFDSAQGPPSFNDATVDVTPDVSAEVALQPPPINDATLNAPSLGSQDGAAQPPSFNDATVDTPPDASQDAAFQLGSFDDATVDAPPSQERVSQSRSFNDATVDSPPSQNMAAPSACLTIDHESTQVKEIKDYEGDDGSLTLSGDNRPAADKPKNVIPNYEILGVLGRGAVGVVYKARQKGLNRLVALKMLLAGSHAGQRELMRFRIEAEAVARLRHPNIVQVYEVGEHNGLPFFSLEFVEGGSLHRKMDGKPLPPREGAEILEVLARAMHYAHENNIIHRDLKPANVLMTPDGVPKITDFGLAKRLEENEESSQTRTGTLMGTPSYMSPEQAEGRTHDIGPLSDQYTLGAILYELLTGRPPFLGATMLETIKQVRKQEPVPPTQLQATTPRDLEVICLKGLQKEPGKRYANAGEMAADLRRFLNGEPIRARPVSLWERMWRWRRRNPRVASLYAAVSALLLLVAVSGGVLSIRMLREQQTVALARDHAEERLKLATDAISSGDVRRANDLLIRSDPLLATASELSEQRERWNTLKRSIEDLGNFKKLLDEARFAYIFGGGSSRKKLMEEAQEYCRNLRTLYDDIDKKRKHFPRLNAAQEQLFKEDVWDMFLLAALIENELAQNAGTAQRHQAIQTAINWLDQADKVLPGLRTFYTHRNGFHASLGHREAADEDKKRALATQPQYAVDRFWHGYAEHVRGDGDKSRGDPAKAGEHYRLEVAEYAALLQQQPDHFWGYFNWAMVKMELNDLEDALIGFTTCVRFRPDFPWPYNNRGTVHLRLGQYDQAIHDYNSALEHSKGDYVMARANRALAYIKKGDIDQALTDCNQVLEQDPRNADAYLHRAECHRCRKHYEEALADCNRVLELNEHKEDVHHTRTAVLEEIQKSGDALLLKRAKAQDQKKGQEFYKQAVKLVSRKEHQQALAYFTATLELLPREAQVYRDRAVVYSKYLKDFDAALMDWRKVIDFWPNKPEAYRWLGNIHLGRRQYDLALQDLENALTRKPDYPEVIHAKAYIYLWQGKAKEALEVIDPLAQKLPAKYEDTLNVRGDIYFRLGRFDDAAADYRRLIQLKPNIPETYVNLALVQCRRGDAAAARQCLDQLVEANPKSALAYLERGQFLRGQGLFEEARKDSEQAARCDAASVLPALLQASITAARGDPASAVATADRIMAEAPKDNGDALYGAAQVWGLASTAATRAGNPQAAQRYADIAVEFLTQALDKGFHDLNYHQHNFMIDDPALESIRQHPQARDLIAHRPLPQ